MNLSAKPSANDAKGAPEVVVIGGGIIGLATAWRMAQGGMRVILLERREVGKGATLASLGALWPANALAKGALQAAQRESLWGYEEFVQEVSAAAGMAVAYRRLGGVELLTTEIGVETARKEARVACERWPRLGGERPVMEVLEPGEAKRLQKGLETGGRWAVVCRCTAQVRVGELVAALRVACERAGVLVREHVTATGLKMEGRRAVGVETGAGGIGCEGVLVSAGAWSGWVSPVVGKAVRMRAVKGQALALCPPAGVMVGTIVKAGGIYLVPWQEEGKNEILVGSTTELGRDEEVTGAGLAFLRAGAEALMPELKGAKVVRHWAGLRPRREGKGHVPMMAAVEGLENVYVSAGHFKMGIGMAPWAARTVAGMILEKFGVGR